MDVSGTGAWADPTDAPPGGHRGVDPNEVALNAAARNEPARIRAPGCAADGSRACHCLDRMRVSDL
jgi:hypothetical protein